MAFTLVDSLSLPLLFRSPSLMTYRPPFHPSSLYSSLVEKSVEDQRHLRRLVAASDGVAFVADGSVLPRRGGSDDRPMEVSRGAVPFQSPESLRREFRLLHRGIVTGMLVPRGVTVIVGGGYHGQFGKKTSIARMCIRTPLLRLLLCVAVQVGSSSSRLVCACCRSIRCDGAHHPSPGKNE